MQQPGQGAPRSPPGSPSRDPPGSPPLEGGSPAEVLRSLSMTSPFASLSLRAAQFTTSAGEEGPAPSGGDAGARAQGGQPAAPSPAECAEQQLDRRRSSPRPVESRPGSGSGVNLATMLSRCRSTLSPAQLSGPCEVRTLLPGVDLREHGVEEEGLDSDRGAGAGGVEACRREGLVRRALAWVLVGWRVWQTIQQARSSPCPGPPCCSAAGGAGAAGLEPEGGAHTAGQQ